MSDVADLWTRIEDAKKRLGMADDAQLKQIQDINEQVKEVRKGLSRRYRELEQHREEVSKLRHENEQLRRMLHRLLLAIEQRYNGRLKDQIKDLEGEVTALVPLTAEPRQGISQRPAAPQVMKPAAPRLLGGAARGAPTRQADPAPSGGQKAETASPSDTDSRWLHEIMERARELTETRGTEPKPGSNDQASRSAVA